MAKKAKRDRGENMMTNMEIKREMKTPIEDARKALQINIITKLLNILNKRRSTTGKPKTKIGIFRNTNHDDAIAAISKGGQFEINKKKFNNHFHTIDFEIIKDLALLAILNKKKIVKLIESILVERQS